MDASLPSKPLIAGQAGAPGMCVAPRRRPLRNLLRLLCRQERRLALAGLLLAQVLLVLFYRVLSEDMAVARLAHEQGARQQQARRHCEALPELAARTRCSLQSRQALRPSVARGG